MIFIRSVILILFCVLVCHHVHAQEKPDTSFNKIPDSLIVQLKDTDGDGVNDNADKCKNEPGPASNFGCPVIAETYLYTNHGIPTPTIFFSKGSSSLSSASFKRLNALVQILKDNPDFYVDLEGYTDSSGSYDFNIKLSMDRVHVAEAYLVSAGINKNRIKTKALGVGKPAFSNENNNRRVEMRLKNY